MKIGVVGAGISGLAISLAAEKAGHEVVIFESESDIGGRMSSIRFGPYIIDIGFHVLHTAYPALHRWIDFSKLEYKEMEKCTESIDPDTGRRKLLADAISTLENKPECLMLASAVGWYGDRGDEQLTEDSTPGEGFLPDICREWEDAASTVEELGVRTVFLRTGIVLTATAGALGKMLPFFKMGGGGPIGNGKQWMSWISLDDEIYAINHLMMNDDSKGVYNLSSPNPVEQKKFAKTLGRVLRRPAFAPLPKFVVKILFGEMGEKLTLESQRVLPTKITAEGYQFVHEDLESGLRDTLGLWK